MNFLISVFGSAYNHPLGKLHPILRDEFSLSDVESMSVIWSIPIRGSMGFRRQEKKSSHLFRWILQRWCLWTVVKRGVDLSFRAMSKSKRPMLQLYLVSLRESRLTFEIKENGTTQVKESIENCLLVF